MDSGFVFVAGTKTGVSLSVGRWLKKSSPLILQKRVEDGTVLDYCILMYA